MLAIAELRSMVRDIAKAIDGSGQRELEQAQGVLYALCAALGERSTDSLAAAVNDWTTERVTARQCVSR